MEASASPSVSKDKVKISKRFSNGLKKLKAKTRGTLHKVDGKGEREGSSGRKDVERRVASITKPSVILPQDLPQSPSAQLKSIAIEEDTELKPKVEPRKDQTPQKETKELPSSKEKERRQSSNITKSKEKAIETWDEVVESIIKSGNKKAKAKRAKLHKEQPHKTAVSSAENETKAHQKKQSEILPEPKTLIPAPELPPPNAQVVPIISNAAKVTTSNTAQQPKTQEHPDTTPAVKIEIIKQSSSPYTKNSNSTPTVSISAVEAPVEQTAKPPIKPAATSARPSPAAHRPFQPYTVSNYERERFQRLVLGMNDAQIRRANRGRGTYEVEVLW